MDPAKVAQIAELEGLEGQAPSSWTPGSGAKDFISGALSGMVGIAAGQPLDTLRVRLQQAGCLQRSALGVWRVMAAAEGPRGLFRGMSYPIYTTALQNAVTFHAQGAATRLLTGRAERPATGGGSVPWQHVCAAGMFAGAVQTAISCPVELLKIRLQLQTVLPGSPGYIGPWGMLRHVLTTEGVCGLFRGFGITLARDTPSYGLYFCLYHWTVAAAAAGLAALPGTPLGLTDRDGQHLPAQQQQQQQQKQQQHGMQPSLSADMLPADGSCSNGRCPSAEAAALAYASSPAVQFVAGGVAGALAWASIYPIDVVKSRVQAAPAHRVAASRVGAWQQGAALIAAEGWAGFSRGLGATMARGFIVNAAIFASFEALQQSLAPM